MKVKEKFLFELIQVSVGNMECIKSFPSEEEWRIEFEIVQKQAIAGVVFSALEKLPKEQRPPKGVLLEWIGLTEQIKSRNRIVNQRSKELQELFSKGGFKSCILKGQGTALYYEKPEYRQSGDIDIWVNGDRDDIIRFVKKRGLVVNQIDIKHSDIDFFEDVLVEVHFLPSWMFCPLTNKKLQDFFKRKAESQFANYEADAGFTHTTVDFDLVFSLVHIYRHVFFEGIGMRQLIDYYYILKNSTAEQRAEAFCELDKIRMAKFAAGMMWVLKECVALGNTYLLCEPDVKHGRFLLSEIMAAGNFGQYDDRFKHQSHDLRWSNGIIQLRRNLHFLKYYPSEVLWSPIWKVWHWCWRKWKGYL